MNEKIILITGGATGIGFAIIKELINNNTVISLDRNPKKIANLKSEIPKVVSIQTDVTIEGNLNNAILEVANQFGRIDIIINNAGKGGDFDFISSNEETLLKDYKSEINVNYYAPLMLTKKALPLLKKSSNPIVVMCSSGLVHTPISSLGSYCASKAALHSITLSLRHQLKRIGIKVIEVYPPSVDTAMNTAEGITKLTPQQFAKSFVKNLKREKSDINIGQSKSLSVISRFLPKMAFKMLNPK